MNNLDFIKIKTFSSVKNTVIGMKKKATDWGKTFEKKIPDEGLLFKMSKELLKLNNDII